MALRRWLRERRTLFLRQPLIKTFGSPGLVVRMIKIRGTKAEREVDAWFDTATYYGAIQPGLAEEVGVKSVGKRRIHSPLLKEPLEVELVEVEVITINGKSVKHPRLTIVERLPAGVDIIVGNEIMQTIGVLVAPKEEVAIVRNPNEYWDYTTW